MWMFILRWGKKNEYDTTFSFQTFLLHLADVKSSKGRKEQEQLVSWGL